MTSRKEEIKSGLRRLSLFLLPHTRTRLIAQLKAWGVSDKEIEKASQPIKEDSASKSKPKTVLYRKRTEEKSKEVD